jgi:hypothetical protein
MKIRDIKIVQPDPQPGGYTAWGTEDIISLGGNTTWGGTAMTDADALIVERFKFDGGDWQSPSGTGSFIGDGDLVGGDGSTSGSATVILQPRAMRHRDRRAGTVPLRADRRVRRPRRRERRVPGPVSRCRDRDCRTDWTTVGINGDAPPTPTSGATTSPRASRARRSRCR